MKCFFHHAALGLLLVSWATASERPVDSEQPHAATTGRPNILWIVAEDMGPELSRHQIPELHTPTLDRLAQQGMEYRNTFTVTPVCSTSRSSFMTGMYAMSIDAHNHRSHRDGKTPLPDGVRLVTDRFREAGYRTANLKKLTTDLQASRFYRGTGKTDWNFSYPKGSQPFDMNRWDQLKANQPFLAQLNFSETHRGRSWNQAHRQIAQPARPARVKIPPYYPDHPVTRAVWAQYLNGVMAVDKKVQFVLERLKQDGLERNTIIVFMSDHGRAMPRAKQWPYDSGLRIPLLIYWPENNPQLPPPRGYRQGAIAQQMVSSLDITATLLAFARIAKPPQLQGRVLLGDAAEPERQYVFGGRDRGDETVLSIRTVRSQRFRYLRNRFPEKPFLQLNRYKEAEYPILGLMRHLHAQGQLTGPPARYLAPRRPAEELYDLEVDPYEINNLAGNPEYATIQQRLAAALDAWIEQIDDQGRKLEAPEIAGHWEERMRRTYDQRLQTRPSDWFLRHPALGPYVQR